VFSLKILIGGDFRIIDGGETILKLGNTLKSKSKFTKSKID
jgi:hypothetical protein